MKDHKIVHKPWGKEVWLELNDKYCYKRIYINKGTRTSFQYHEKKLETNYIISGTAEVWLENDDGEIVKTIKEANDFFTVTPPKKHRVIALTDLVLQEVSTPEVDDVIRIQDDARRSDGRLDYEHHKNAACILMAGTGRRMGEFADVVHKGLLPLDNKAIVSHIIEKIPEEYEIVIALGYKKDMVKEYCLAAHPERKFVFVDVENYEGEDSGPSYSIDKCRKYLQRPFYFITADTFIEEELPSLKNNWLGLSRTSLPELYSTVALDGNQITSFKNKDKKGHENAFIGLAAIYDFKTFWEQLDVESGEIVSAFYNIDKYSNFQGEHLTWYDAGTIDSYLKLRDKLQTSEKMGILKTNGEFVYKINESFLKLSNNTETLNKRIKRQSDLEKYTPKMLFKGEHLFSYNFVKGQTLYEKDDIELFKSFLNFAQDNFWSQTKTSAELKDACQSFYKGKTLKRLSMFLGERDDFYRGAHVVNGDSVRDIDELLNSFDWQSLCDEPLGTNLFHGDLQFDNILFSEDEEFVLIDWRDSFADLLSMGDVYYDLAKLYGGALISYSLMKDESNFSLGIDDREISYTHKRTKNLRDFAPHYESWLVQQGDDLLKVKKIVALIFLNMSPLHSKRFGDFLFFKSKRMLEELNDK